MNTKHYFGAASPAVLAMALLLVPALAQAQATPPAASNDEASQVETVVVTGSRLASRGFSAPTPVAVVGAEEFKLSGTVNAEQLLGTSPQFVGSQNNGQTANTVPGGTATLNLRGFGAQRNLVLVNGRRFAIAGADQTTDINTIPVSLIKQTEVVTGGSSAVYGSDAITGVVNFIMREDFEGVELNGQTSWDSHTTTPTYNLDLTVGGNFAEGRGNAVVSVNYLDRGAISRGMRGHWTYDSLSDGCVTAGSFSKSKAGTPLAVPAGQTCVQAGGRMGLIAGGSGDIPNGRFTGVPVVGGAGSTPGLDAALIAAGLGSMGSRGFTFNTAGTTARPALTPQDDFNLGPDNYLIIPQKRWMMNVFSHYDFNSRMTGYFEGHFSNNVVDMQLAPTNINGPFLFNTNNPYLSASMQEVLRQMDLKEVGTTTVTTGTATRTTVAGDGLAVINVGRRLREIGLRRNNAERNVWRFATGLRGDLGSVSDSFLRNLSYDAYYTYARTSETDHQEGNASRSRFQANLLSVGGAAPVLNIFGANISAAGISAISIAATNITEAEQQVASAGLSGEAFSLPAGPVDFSTGLEWRYNSARYTPDEFLRSGDVVGFNPGLPTGGSTIVKEVYGEARVPILADLPFVKNLSANGAFRYSDYNLKGVGGVWTYSVGGAWQVTSDVNFRGQFQHAIRAPNVGELYGGLAQSFDAATDPCSSRAPTAQQTAAVRAICVATGVPTAAVFTPGVQSNTIIGNLQGGNPNVGIEKSDTYTFGAVITPRAIPGLAVSVDYFNIDLDGAISALGGGLNNTLNLCYNIVQDATSEFCQAIKRNPVTGEIAPPYYATITNANTGGLKTAGIDFVANYRFSADFGIPGLSQDSRFEISTEWTWLDEFTSTPVQAFPNIKNYCVGAYGPTCGQPIPEWKGGTRVVWKTGPLTLNLRHRYVGEVMTDKYILPKRAGGTVPTLESLTNPKLPAQNYFDASFTYDIVENVQVYGGVNNIADRDPPVLGSSSPSANTYAATYDVLGTTFFLGGKLKF